MTATGTIHGITMYAAGPIAHHKRWHQGVYLMWCSATDGPCQGHAKPKPAEVAREPEPMPENRPGNGAACTKGHTDTYFHMQPSDRRWHMRCRTCRNVERQERRDRFNGRVSRTRKAA